MSEEWRPVVGYEGNYEVSNQGRVRSLARNVIGSDGRPKRFNGGLLSPATSAAWSQVALSVGGQRKSLNVARLVLEAFVGPCPEGQECVYVDGNPLNTALANLKWGNGRRRTFFALIENFWKRVDKSGDCWLWTGEVNNMGYGVYCLYDKDRREKALAHRISALMAGLPAYTPQDTVMHMCDTPRCVRPEHLSIGTQLDNIRDAKKKGRMNTDGLFDLVAKTCKQCGVDFMGVPATRYCEEHRADKRWSA